MQRQSTFPDFIDFLTYGSGPEHNFFDQLMWLPGGPITPPQDDEAKTQKDQQLDALNSIGRGGAQAGFDVPGDTGYARSLPERMDPDLESAIANGIAAMAPGFGLAKSLADKLQGLTGVPGQQTSAKIGLMSPSMRSLQGLEAAARSLSGKDISGPAAGIAGPVSGAARSTAGKVGGRGGAGGQGGGSSGGPGGAGPGAGAAAGGAPGQPGRDSGPGRL